MRYPISRHINMPRRSPTDHARDVCTGVIILPPTVTSSASRCQARRTVLPEARAHSDRSRESVQQIHEAQDCERHRVVHHAITTEVADHVSRRRCWQITKQVRRHWREIAAIAKRYRTADHKYRPARAVDVTKIPAIVTPHAVPIVRAIGMADAAERTGAAHSAVVADDTLACPAAGEAVSA